MTTLLPLTGIRVVEVAGLGPTPHAATLLADLGADVVRVSRPTTAARQDRQLRGRRTIVADLKQSNDRATVARLVERSDVLLEGFRPGVMERLGLGPEVCLAANPTLVYARMTGWGQSGPLAPRAGHDINYLGLTGALHALGRSGNVPDPPLNLVGDFGGGSLFVVVGILAALVARHRGHRQGRVIDAAVVDGTAMLQHLIWALRAGGRWSDERGTNFLDGSAPYYRTYRCADDAFVAVGALEEPFYRLLVAGLALDAETLPDRLLPANWPRLAEMFAARFATRTRAEWTEVFEQTDACVSPVLSYAEAATHPHNVARDTYIHRSWGYEPAPAPMFDGAHPPAPGQERPADADTIISEWSRT